MTLKTAALLALLGTLLVTLLLAYGFIKSVIELGDGLIPLATVVTSLIYTFASLTVTLFFFVFHKQA
jgi:hypothetical protein